MHSYRSSSIEIPLAERIQYHPMTLYLALHNPLDLTDVGVNPFV